MRAYFEEGPARHWHADHWHAMPVDYAEPCDLGHERKEVRRLWISTDVAWLPRCEAWADPSSIAMIEHERHTQSSISLERRFYTSSLAIEAHEMLRLIRSHWCIENGLH